MTSTQIEISSTNEDREEIKKKRKKQAPILSDSEEEGEDTNLDSHQRVPDKTKEEGNHNDFEIKEFGSQDDLQKSLASYSPHQSQVCCFKRLTFMSYLHEIFKSNFKQAYCFAYQITGDKLLFCGISVVEF